MLPLIGGAVVVVLVAACVWRVRHPRGPSMVVVSRKQAAREPYPYLYVNADGSARELHPNERKYLETPFQGGDGARPYAKRSYSQKKWLGRSQRLSKKVEATAGHSSWRGPGAGTTDASD
jgi:hypothetical protein